MTDNLFKPIDDQVDDEPADYVEALVGEGKKYKDADALAKALWHADRQISRVERENAELRDDNVKFKAEIDQGASVKELLETLKAERIPPKEPKEREEVKQPVIDPNAIEEIVVKTFNEKERVRREQANLKMVQDKLIERFGKNYPSVLKQQVEQLGLTEDSFHALAKSTPQLVFNALGLDRQPQREEFQTPPSSSRGRDNFSPGNEKRTWAWYQKLKKDNYRLYSDPKTQMQLEKDYAALGEAFEDGDFNSSRYRFY